MQELTEDSEGNEVEFEEDWGVRAAVGQLRLRAKLRDNLEPGLVALVNRMGDSIKHPKKCFSDSSVVPNLTAVLEGPQKCLLLESGPLAMIKLAEVALAQLDQWPDTNQYRYGRIAFDLRAWLVEQLWPLLCAAPNSQNPEILKLSEAIECSTTEWMHKMNLWCSRPAEDFGQFGHDYQVSH